MIRPFVVGGAMAAMMLWMGHGQIMSGEIDVTAGAILFGLTHVLVLIAVLGIAFVFPPVRRFLRGHRPSARHVTGMLAGMVLAAGSIHLAMHGVLL